MNKTFLYDFQINNKANMEVFYNWNLPAYYNGISEEAKTCRSDVALFDVSHMRQIQITGGASEKLLATLTPTNIAKMNLQKVKYSVFLNKQGHIVDDVLITKDKQDSFFIVCNASRISKVMDLLDEYKTSEEKILIQDTHSLLALQGPRAYKIIEELFGYDTSDHYFMTSEIINYKDSSIRVSRCGYTGEDGFELSINNAHVLEVANTLVKEYGVKLAGLGARDILRVEAGLFLYGQDIDDSLTPAECGLNFVVAKSRLKTLDFLGADVVAKQISDGKKSLFIALKFKDLKPVRFGYDLHIKLQNKDQVVGKITSGAVSPHCGIIALARIDPSKLHLITSNKDILFANIREHTNFATIVTPPFLPHKYYKENKS